MKKTVTKYPVITFCILALFLLSIIGGINLILFPSSFNYALMFPQWTPALAALIVVGIINGKSGISELFRKSSIKTSSVKWIMIAVFIPMVCCCLSYVAFMFAEYNQWVSPTFTRSLENYAICFAATIFGSYGEEIGWRGFMLPQLNKKYSLFVSSFIVGLIWGVWHLRFQIGLSAFGLFILGVICYSFLISWLCCKTKGNIFVAIVFHTVINMCSLILFEKELTDIAEQQTEVQIVSPQLYAMLYGIYAVIFTIPCIFVAKKMIGKETIHKINFKKNAKNKYRYKRNDY